MGTHLERIPGFVDSAATECADWSAEQGDARLAALVSCSPDAIISLDTSDWRILTWNPAATQLFGYTEQEATGSLFAMLSAEPGSEEPRSLFGAALEGKPLRIETVRRRKDGRPVEVSLTAARIQSSSGHIVGMVAIIRDITERRRTERALAAQSRVLAMLHRSGSITSGLDVDEVIRSATEAGLELTGARVAAFVFADALGGRDGCLCYASPAPGQQAACRFLPLDGCNARPADLPLHEPMRSSDVLDHAQASHAMASWAERLDLAIRSCLVVPVTSRGGDLIGALIFGHSEPAWFTAEHEQLVGGVARQASIALRTVRQYQDTRRELEERRKAEAVLRASETQFRLLADAMPQMVWSTSADGEGDYYNRRWCAFVGQSSIELIGEKWLELVHPDDRARADRSWSQALASGEDYEAEYRMRRHDGVYRWFLDRALALRGDDGRILRWIGTCTDIDEQKQTEMESRRLREVVEQSPDFIGYAAPDGQTLYLNPAGREMVGLADLAAAQRTRFQDFFHPRDWQLVQERLRAGRRAGSHWSGEFRLRRFDTGATVPVDYHLFATHDSSGRPTGLAAITRDISTRKSAEEARQLLIRELNHRVKNLFAIAAGIVAMSARASSSPREMADAVRGRLGALARAHDLIRATVTAETPGGEPTTLHDVLSTVTAPHAGGSGQIVIDGPAVAIGANAATSIALVLHELATNAVKYGALSTADGQVRILWSADDSTLLLTWQESGGPPIPEPPAAEGFGAQLARMSITGQLGGSIDTRWESRGVRVMVTIPLDRLAR